MLWQADLVQAVIFSQPGVPQPEALALWTELFGSEGPDNYQRLPQNPAAPTTASGIRDGMNLTIASQVGRVDIVLQSADALLNAAPGGAAPPPPHFVKDFAKGLKNVSTYAGELSSKFNIARLAVVLSLSAQPEGSSTSVISEAADVVFPDGVTDVIYQYNMRDKSKVAPDVVINRLVTWSAAQLQILRISEQGSQDMGIRDVVNWKIDINTGPNSSFDQAKVPAMFAELADIALVISDRGAKVFS